MRQFSAEHLVVLALTAAAIVVAVKVPRPKVLAVLIGGAFAIEFAVRATDGSWDWGFDLPLHLSDVVSILAPIALWTRRPLLVEVLYFWALTASLQAVITPDLRTTVPSVFFFTYFVTHSGAVVAAFLLVFGLGQRPRPGAVARVFAVTLGMAAAAGLGNVITGGNYMYLRAKPAQASLLDQMGPWPVYIAVAAALALVLFLALDRLARSTGADA
ncbi:YwaF family protein [Solirubrobacter deserti]|uniref:TIGR02206 family membrane protein n=1 Tax=Solirubrobacter deserti TaxID=2282478 RepID=A0ABT4RCS3_9ACTN|nr:TIGR02206 family membrane protein [Solirubrobacter deserti]MDA0136322.1 TIGR02206 family membrane protein [Solirubrobacter deserti]